jgi:anti-anti-sigma factor
MTPLVLEWCRLNSGVLISVSGEMDITNAARLDSLAGKLRRSGEPLVLDLGKLTFMDSSGLNVLLHLHKASREEGGGLHVVGLQQRPARLLKITGMEQALHIHSSVDEAVATALAIMSPVPPQSSA